MCLDDPRHQAPCCRKFVVCNKVKTLHPLHNLLLRRQRDCSSLNLTARDQCTDALSFGVRRSRLRLF